MNCRMCKWFLFFLWLFHAADSYKFLFYQTLLGRSHMQFSGALIDALVDAGHEVHLLVAEWNPHVATNGTDKATSVRRIRTPFPSAWMLMSHMTGAFTQKVTWLSPEDMLHWHNTTVEFCRAIVEDDALLDWIREQRFDAGFTVPYDYCGHGIFHVVGIKAVAVYSATPAEDTLIRLLGIPNPASYLPNTFRASTLEADNLGYFSRIRNLLLRVTLPFSGERDRMFGQTEVFRKKFGASFPQLDSVFATTGLVFVNSAEFLDLPRPITHKIIYIGGIAMAKPRPLKHPELETILNGSKSGVVLFSFGSLAKTTEVPLETKLQFINAFRQFPDYSFIWKYDSFDDDFVLFANTSNIHLVPWLPQVDLLNDHRVKAFITHAGLNSLTESAFAGQPMLTIPLFGDQQYNAGVAVKRGVGIFLDKTRITEREIVDSLEKLLHNPSYRLKAQRIAQMLKRKPTEAKQQFINWAEFLAEFKDLSHLQLASVNLTYLQYFCLDIIIPAIVAVCIFLCTLFVVARRCVVRIRFVKKHKLQ